MGDYRDIQQFNQVLAEPNLGAVNMGWWNGQNAYEYNVPAINSMSYYDEYHAQRFPTYSVYANYYERNRRLNGAYGNAYEGEASWLEPDLFHPVTENHFYYLEDMVNGGAHQNTFIEGLTWFQRQKPNLPPQMEDSSFVPANTPNTYYRIDILGSAYPYYNGSEKIDVIIQQFIPYRNSNKIQVSYNTLLGFGAWHSDYQLRIPVTVALFNDKLYDVPPPVYEPPEDQPIINPTPPINYPDDYDGNDGINYYAPPAQPDPGPSPNADIDVNPYNSAEKGEVVERYFPYHGWRRWVRWY